MKLVLDTDVLIAGLRSPTGASAELLRRARERRVQLAIIVPLVLEYEAVAFAPEHLAASDLTREACEAIINSIVGVSEWIMMHFSWRPQVRDPNDEMVLETAINARADALVTFNRRDYGDAPGRFGIGCWLPSEALEKMR